MNFSTYKKLFYRNESPKKGSFVFWCVISLLFIFLDQLSKFFVYQISSPAPKYFGILLFNNFNFAFSLYLPQFLMLLIYALLIAAIFYNIYRNFNSYTLSNKYAWVLILSGAVSNVLERLTLGYVRDFIYIFSGIFNLADFFIILGVLILLFKSNKKFS